MTFNRISEILDDAKDVHSNLRGQINFAQNNKRHAVYLLQGGILTAIFTALDFNDKSYLVPRAQQKRMIDEIIDLITFFDEGRENSRQLRAWFAGRIIQREPDNQGNLTAEDRAARANLSAEQIHALDNLRREANHIMSQYMHPSIEAVRANVFRRTHVIDYKHEHISSQHRMSANQFGNLYVVPGLHALLLPASTLPLSEADFHRLRDYDREIQASV